MLLAEQRTTNNFPHMTRYFTVLGKEHTSSSFRVVLLLEDRVLVHRRLEVYSPDEFNLEENMTTDRYVVEAFMRKREYASRQWLEVAEEEYRDRPGPQEQGVYEENRWVGPRRKTLTEFPPA
jgi:hypothetical protein